MRLDRSITLGLVRPLRRAIRALEPRPSSPGAIPILMYHSISDDPELGVQAYYRTTTSPSIFAQHMAFLASHGYRGVTLTEGLAWLQSSALCPESSDFGIRTSDLATPPSALCPLPSEKLVAITFDDGFANFYTQAFPVLQEYKFRAAVFLPTAFIQSPRRSFKDTECLTWNEVRELRKEGIQFGSHTVNHPRLVELSWKEVADELRESKQELEQQLGEPATTFAYPFAFPQADRVFVQDFRRLLAETGYTCCATTELGRVRLGDDPYRLKRLPANSLDDPRLFRAKLEGCYDWLGLAQAMIKRIKRSGVASRKQTDLSVHTRHAGSN